MIEDQANLRRHAIEHGCMMFARQPQHIIGPETRTQNDRRATIKPVDQRINKQRMRQAAGREDDVVCVNVKFDDVRIKAREPRAMIAPAGFRRAGRTGGERDIERRVGCHIKIMYGIMCGRRHAGRANIEPCDEFIDAHLLRRHNDMRKVSEGKIARRDEEIRYKTLQCCRDQLLRPVRIHDQRLAPGSRAAEKQQCEIQTLRQMQRDARARFGSRCDGRRNPFNIVMQILPGQRLSIDDQRRKIGARLGVDREIRRDAAGHAGWWLR